ncbi:MAG: hypothetical protein ABJI43_15435 [Roseobacter sp.]
MKTIYLHIGRGKTGTTAQQRFLSDHHTPLLEAGIDYLNGGGGHQAFAKSFITHPPDYMTPVPNPRALRHRIAKAIVNSTASDLLISSENFPLCNIPVLADWFAALPVQTQIKVLFFVRSQDEVAESEYNQMVKLKRETRSFASYAATLEGADYYAECEAWANVFGQDNIIARVYDGAANTAVTDFLDCLPSGVKTLLPLAQNWQAVPGDAANQSLGARALHLARLLNAVELEGRAGLYDRLFAALGPDDLPAVLMNADQAARYRAQFEDSNARFAARYLGRETRQLGGRRFDDGSRNRLNAALSTLELSYCSSGKG